MKITFSCKIIFIILNFFPDSPTCTRNSAWMQYNEKIKLATAFAFILSLAQISVVALHLCLCDIISPTYSPQLIQISVILISALNTQYSRNRFIYTAVLFWLLCHTQRIKSAIIIILILML